jgi:branched-subunit amino acid transport protein
MTVWIAILAVGLGSYLFRLAPLLIAQRVRWPEPVDRAMQHAGRAAVVYLVVTYVIGAAGSGGTTALVGLATGMAAGLAVALRGHGFNRVMVTGTVVGLAVSTLAGLLG